MKNLVMALGLSTALAAGAASANSFNTGLALGVGHAKAKVSNSGDIDVANGNIRAGKRESAMNGVVGGVFAGWSTTLVEGDMPVHAGVELAFDMSGVKGRSDLSVNRAAANSDALTMSIKRKNSIQMLGLIGTTFGGAKVDLRLGYDSSKFDIKTNATEVAAVSSKNKKSKRLNGVVVGLGVSGKVTEAMTLGLTYDYTMFGTLKADTMSVAGVAGVANNARTRVKMKVKPSMGVAKIRFGYHF